MHKMQANPLSMVSCQRVSLTNLQGLQLMSKLTSYKILWKQMNWISSKWWRWITWRHCNGQTLHNKSKTSSKPNQRHMKKNMKDQFCHCQSNLCQEPLQLSQLCLRSNKKWLDRHLSSRGAVMDGSYLSQTRQGTWHLRSCLIHLSCLHTSSNSILHSRVSQKTLGRLARLFTRQPNPSWETKTQLLLIAWTLLRL